MTIAPRTLALAATAATVLALGGGYLAVRAHRAPPPAVRETSHEATTAATHVEAAAVERRREHAHVSERVTYLRPDGSIRAVREREERTAEVATVRTAEVATATTTATREATREVTPAPPPRPSWRVEARAEWSAHDLTPRPELRAEVSRRLLGPLWLFAAVAPPGANPHPDARAGVLLSLDW